jgi:hypothetical protein
MSRWCITAPNSAHCFLVYAPTGSKVCRRSVLTVPLAEVTNTSVGGVHAGALRLIMFGGLLLLATLALPKIMIEFENVRAGYGGGDVLQGVTLTVDRASITCVVGPNGAGKSTLLRALSGLAARAGDKAADLSGGQRQRPRGDRADGRAECPVRPPAREPRRGGRVLLSERADELLARPEWPRCSSGPLRPGVR